MKIENSHYLLALAPDQDHAADAVRRFFARTQLVRYDKVDVDQLAIQAAGAPDFWPKVDEALARNRQVLLEIIEELKKSGIRSLDDLAGLPQGYQSKLAHTATHLLDGFFGIDSVFYSLVEDSHWISPPLGREIRRNPEDYYLVPVKAELFFAKRQQLVSTLRSFES